MVATEIKPTTRGYRPDIDGLRAVAILLVLLFHAWPAACRGGFVGVDVFFVISGYLITGIIADGVRDKTFRFRHFYARRIRRLVPSLIVVVVATLIASFFILNIADFTWLANTALLSTVFITNVMLYLKTNYFDDLSGDSPLAHTWSLGVEEQFYLLWPLLLFLVARIRRRHATTMILGAITILSLALNLAIARRYPSADFYLLPPRLWEMAIGGLLAVHHLSADGTRAWWRGPLAASIQSFIGLALIAAAAWGLSEANTYPGWWAFAPVAGAALLIDAGAGSWLNRTFLAAPPMRFIGLISYQLYLWHWPLLALTRKTGHSGIVAIVGAILAAFVLAWLTQFYIERPFRNRNWSATFSYRRAVPILSSGLVVAMVLAIGARPAQIRFLLQGAPAWAWTLAKYRFDERTEFRLGTCFLYPGLTYADYQPACFGRATEAARKEPLVLVWGDSHAAHLYPGLRVWAAAKNLDLAQLDNSSCPPIAGFNSFSREDCATFNDAILHWIATARPDEVILGGRWANYFAEQARNPAALSAAIVDTVRRLKEVGVRRVVLVGPVPTWEFSLPLDLISYQRRHKATIPPLKMKDNLSTEAATADPMMKAVAMRAGAVYVSPYSLLCDNTGCQATVPGANPVEPTSFDHGHLTTAGSIYLVNLMKPDL